MPRGVYFNERDAQRIAESVRGFEAGRGGGRADKRPTFDRNFARILFKNSAGETAPAYGLLRITGMTSVDGVLHYTIGKPNGTFSRFYLVNGSEDVADTAFGWATWAWHGAEVLYDTGTPAYGESWGAKSGQWSLAKWRYGFTIAGGNLTTPSRTVAVQHVVNHFWGQTDAAINKGSTGTVSVYDGNDADATDNVSSVKNKFANVAISKKVGVHWFGGAWYLTSAEC